MHTTQSTVVRNNVSFLDLTFLGFDNFFPVKIAYSHSNTDINTKHKR